MAGMADISEQIEALKTTRTAQLLVQYKELLGDKVASGNRIFLIRRLPYRIQGQALGEAELGNLDLAPSRSPFRASLIASFINWICCVLAIAILLKIPLREEFC